jgi:dTDP-4-dehydro-6-deoxy-alpha-D-glucopyranose 2,3-dehydratase
MSPALGYLRSAVTENGPFGSTAQALSWLDAMKSQQHLVVTPIPLDQLGEWSFEQPSGDIVHKTGKFFRVSGVHVESDLASRREWDQPIIDQPEIGILGILTREFDGLTHLLMQAKMEPGNPRGIQLTPTVQATQSNYTQVHHGSRPTYLDYFLQREQSSVGVDQLQWEQGSAFLRKRNRNIVVAAAREVPMEAGFRWLTIAQVRKLLAHPNLVSMDTRTVLACMPLVNVQDDGWSHLVPSGETKDFAARVLASYATLVSYRSDNELLDWIAGLKSRYPLTVRHVGLSRIQGWRRTDREIKHDDGVFYSVIGLTVESDSREVARWRQPILGSAGQGLIALLVTEIDGVLHALLKARAEAGSADTVTIGPTIQLVFDRHSRWQNGEEPLYDMIATASKGAIRYSCVQSEEGGRFYRVENLYRIVEIDNAADLPIPAEYTWVTFRQMHHLIGNGLLSVEARSLLACLTYS